MPSLKRRSRMGAARAAPTTTGVMGAWTKTTSGVGAARAAAPTGRRKNGRHRVK